MASKQCFEKIKMKLPLAALLATAIGILLMQAVQAATIPTVPVGDPGNSADPTFSGNLGAVDYGYRIGKYEVTNSQYAEFLNAKAKSDPLQLYDEGMTLDPRGGITRTGSPGSYSYAPKANMGNKPVNHVNFYDALRFSNWLNNGQGAGDTESGAYSLVGGAIPSNGTSITRNAGAKWFLPSADEWYKAAYYQPASDGGDTDNYWLYPTRSNDTPTKAMINSPTLDISNPGPNVVNYDSGINFLTSVGTAGPQSAGYYGTSDQAGNVSEWTDTSVSAGAFWVRPGGHYNSAPSGLQSGIQTSFSPLVDFPTVGFRVAADISVPEPSALLLSFVALCGLTCWSIVNRSR